MKETKKLFFFIFLLLFYKIQSEPDCTSLSTENECTTTDTNLKNCRWIKIFDKEYKCIDCSEISDGESEYYSVKLTVDNEPYCHKVGKSGYAGSKLIFNRKQVVNNCKEFGLKTFGEFCYETCPDNSVELTNGDCKCNNLFYKEIKEGLIYINCLSEGLSCPNGYNYIYNNECIKACPDGKEKLEKENDNYLCVDSCSSSKKIYVTKSPLGKSITYCLDACPEEVKFYYEDNICLEKCSKNNKDFYNSEHKCISHSNVEESDCGSNYYITISPEEYIFQCLEREATVEPCQDSNYPYKFNFEGKDHCLKSCDDTNIKFFDDTITYLFEEEKQCIDVEQKLSNTNYFMIEKEKKFVSDCSKEEYWPYHDGQKCVPNCGSKYIKEDTNECVTECGDGYFKDEKTKICFKGKCPDHLGRGFYDNNNKCVECGIDGEEKGFHMEKDDAKCYTECPSGYKHNYNNNICFMGDCKNTDYKYSYDGDAKTCYYSCKDIGDDYIIEKDFKCYKDTDSSFNDKDYYFYQTSYGLKKYILKNKALSECFKNGLKYLRNNECVQQCNEEEYKVFPTYEKFGICFDSDDKCKEKNYKFYTKAKVCSETCQYYTISDDTGETEVDNGNCHEECPSEYQFLEGTICKNKCSDGKCYIEDNGIKKCTDKGGYFAMKINEDFKCVKYCTDSMEGEDENKIPIFSYYDSSKNCRDTCIGNTGNEFSYEAINEHKKCLSGCLNDEYYYEDKKICLKKCDKYYKSKNSKICVENCQNGEYIHPGNICSTEKCPKEAPFFIKETTNNIEIKKCIFSCDNYYIYETKECIESYLSSKSILYGGLTDSCPTGYSNDSENKCTKPEDCGEKPFFSVNENEHACLNEETECDNYRFLTSIGECVQKCPIGEHFVKNGNKCSVSCDNKYTVKDDNGDYIIYECVDDECSSQKKIFEKNECVNNCETYGLIEKDGICYSDCKSINLFEKIDNGKKVCVDGCDGLYYNNEDKVCENECSFHSTKIVNRDEKLCIDKCDNFLQIKNNKLYCSSSCDDPENKRYLENGSKCIPKCPNTHYVESDTSGKCIEISLCDKKLIKRGEEYFCEESCSGGLPYSYQDSNYCISNCDKEDYVIQDTHTCIKSCSELNTETSTDKYYFYEYDKNQPDSTIIENTCVKDCSATNKPYTRKNGHCDTDCDSNTLGDYYYMKDTQICLEKESCDKIDGRICLNSGESCESKYMDENKFCLSNCYFSTNKKIYYKNGEYTCSDEHINSILENNIIKNECGESNNFYKDNQCVETCPKGWNFYKGESTNTKCLNDCPINEQPTFQYYQIETLASSISMFKCQESCNSYVILDKNKNARLCIGEKCNSDYPYYTSDDNPKECFKECPNGFKYYYKPDNAGDEFKCIDSDSCPDNYIFYQNTKKCIKESECNLKHINKDTNECVLHCEEGQVFYEDGEIIYCSNSCNNIQENLHLDLNGKQCKDGVEDNNCNTNEKIDTESDIKKCDCENLYYNDISSGLKVCIDKNEINCNKQIEYPYLIKDTKQCSHECSGVLSLNGQICHTEANFKCPDNSEVKKNSKNINQCTCKYKYYHYETENSKEIYCLPEDSKCPRNQTFNRELLIEETKECVEYCPYENQAKKYGKTCVNLCPILSVVVNDECFCQDKWYMNSNDEMICTNQCPSDKPIIIDQTKECVETCKDTKFPVFYKNKCYLDCSNFPDTNQINNIKDIESIEDNTYKGYKLDHFYGKYGENVCYCKGAWFEDSVNSNDGCNEYENSECDVYKDIYAYKYIVLPIKKCVTECPEEFPYSFNDKCFESCEEGNKLLGINEDNAKNGIMSSDNSKICVCKNLWKYNEEDISKKECLSTDKCDDGFLLIFATKECYKGTVCREENPLLFNNECYNKNNCPENTSYKEDSPKTCSCVNYFYIDSNDHNYIKCLPIDDKCPDDYPNLIISKNKCVKNVDEELNNLYSFNKIYYNNCPTYTKYDEGNKICICDNLYRFWYKDDSGVLTCGLTQCTTEKPKYIGETKECVSKCEGGLVEYNGICYDKCPELTENKEGVCELSQTNNSNNITAISQFINNNIVGLYTSSKANENNDEKEDIIELVNLKSTIEFYGANKNKADKKSSHNNKAKKSSSLSYIDLGECLDKIYTTYKMDPEIDDVIILKYDLMDTPKEYLINPVEYKFINSRNGQEIEASICPQGSIKISYPFFNIINQYNQKSRRNLETIMINIKNENDLNLVTEKYNIGKEINEKYPNVDSFNSKDGIYTDFCSALEINGKDLALEDRLNVLLPHYSLCEQNCTYNHTDFQEERIYCDCSFKNEFDLNREHQSSLEINENAVIQSQSGKTNFPVLKCLPVLGDGGRIKKNIAFYYMLIIIIIEIVFLCMLIVYEMNSFKSFLSQNLCENNLEDSKVDIGLGVNIINGKDKSKISNKKYDDAVKTTQRALHNPPIKKNNDGDDDTEYEFIPNEFLFLYFNKMDKGVKKKVKKSLLPFDIKKNTKVLLQKLENVDYSNVKASGPFNEEQNVVEIIFDNGENDNNINIESINESILETNNNLNEKNKSNEKDIITVNEKKKIEPKIYKRENLTNYIINNFDEIEEKIEDKKDVNTNQDNLLDDLKLEQRLLTKEYDFAIRKQDNNFITVILAEILDKIYIARNTIFLRKYDSMYLYLSLYVLYHVILLNILAMFYDINTIKNIWNKENYPGMGFYLGYGILVILIVWFIYIIFECLLSNKGKYNEILMIKYLNKIPKESKPQLISKRINSLLSKMKTKMIIYYIIQFALIIFFFIYLVVLCAVYTGTMDKIFTSYGIAILELIILKLIYGLILGILRYYSIENQKSSMYNFVLFMDTYLV